MNLFYFFLILFPGAAWAHGIGEVYRLPVPLSYYLWGAGLAVAASFFVLGFFIRKAPEGSSAKIFKIPALSKIIFLFKIAGVFFLLLTILAGIFGADDYILNFAPIFFWVFFLVGFIFVSCLVGNIWEKLNPWKTLGSWMGFSPFRESKFLGAFGVILLVLLFWWELSSGLSFIPSVIGFVLLGYTFVNIFCASIFKNWFRDGEVFSVMFGFIGNVAPFKISEDNYAIVYEPYAKKLDGRIFTASTLGVASVLLAGATFDGIKETQFWYDNFSLITSFGILVVPFLFFVPYIVAIWLMRKLTKSEFTTMGLARRFVVSLAPIAAGYILAHNFPLFIISLPAIYGIISDPFGFGWNIFGTAALREGSLVLGARAVWFTEIGLVVLAHIAGIWFAHLLAVKIFKNERTVLRSQYPMMILMVLYTVATLWLLSQPLVTAKPSTVGPAPIQLPPPQPAIPQQ